MNDSLYTWLGSMGFTGSLNDRQKQALLLNVVGASSTDSLNDLWLKYGLQEGYGTSIQEIQKNWAISVGAASTGSWNDAMSTLVAAFSPLSLFAGGEQGVWYDPSDLSTLFQDSAGTIPVTAAGQPVGRMNDKSGNANHATQVTAASRPILRNSGALWWLEFDGVDDFLVTGNINFTARDEISVFAGLRKLSDAAVGLVAELSVNANANNGSFILTAPNNAGGPNILFASRGTAIVSAMANPVTAPGTVVATGQADISTPLVSTRINGTLRSSSATSQGTGNYGTFPLYIGRRGGTTLPFWGNLYGLIVRGLTSTAGTVTSVEAYMAQKSGVPM